MTIGVGTEQVDDFIVVTVATVVVTTVVGEGVAVRMQEQALLSLHAGYDDVIAGRSRFSFAGVSVVLRDRYHESILPGFDRQSSRGGDSGLDG